MAISTKLKVAGALVAAAAGVVTVGVVKEKFGTKPRVSIINLHGTIMPGKGSPLGGKLINLESTRKMIDKAFKPARLEAVFLNINSPGGSAVQSDLVSTYIKEKAAKHNVPVIVFVEDCAASGGYWLACTGSEIYAARSSVVGSIGVINQGLGFHQLIEKLGIERRTFTAGENKSVMDPLAPLKEKDVEIITGLLNNIHQHFIDHVKASRGERLKGDDQTIFNGEFWTGEPALELGLIDGIDNLESYIARKWEGRKVQVIRVKGGGKLEDLLGEASGSWPDMATSLAPMVADWQVAEMASKFLK
eukprot:TRINITY_DN74659_c0_g1_i1.p1 TRINITY_DN74659_c0_g1~~TRINITY_DN74659_c0_g1_i1.p1  ORF type:complete len:339 (+),score=97.23 TRINITY_DN74659_c0_g1_i1:106-1017(+)